MAMRYDDAGHGIYVGQRPQLLAADIMAARAPHKRTDVHWQGEEARGENTRSSASRNNTWLHGTYSLLTLKALRRLWGYRV